MCCLLSQAIKMWPWYLGLCYHTPLRCPHHSLLCNYTGTRLQLSAKYQQEKYQQNISAVGEQKYYLCESGMISYRILGTRSLAASGIEQILTLLTLSQANLRQEKTVKLTPHKNILYPTRFRLNLTGRQLWGLIVNLWLLGGCCSLYSHDYSDQVCFFEL